MMVVLKSRNHSCLYCGENHLELVAEMPLPDFEIGKTCGITIIWTCPQCFSQNQSKITHGSIEFYALEEEKN